MLAAARERIGEYAVGTPSPLVPAQTLSGGNQQKLIVARELVGDTTILVLDQPTRGLDVGSLQFIHLRLTEQRTPGPPLILVSAVLGRRIPPPDRLPLTYR